MRWESGILGNSCSSACLSVSGSGLGWDVPSQKSEEPPLASLNVCYVQSDGEYGANACTAKGLPIAYA